MCACIYATLIQIINAIHRALVCVMSVYQLKRAVIGGFYTYLYKQMRMSLRCLLSESLFKPIGQIRFDAIGARCNDQTFDSGKP